MTDLKVLADPPPLRLNEMYIACQGEGPLMGRPSVFIRLHGCPVHCKWCDTAFTWDGSEEGESVTVDELVRRAVAYADGVIKHAVITGGEPLVTRALPAIIDGLADAGFTVEVETAGVLKPNDPRLARASWILSPKMPSAEPKMKPDPEVLACFFVWYTAPHVALKIVISNSEDYEHMLALCDSIVALGHDYIRERTYLMPCGTTRAAISDGLRWLLNKAPKDGFNVTTRMHVTAFGDERGR
jgi:7-cyano-7-deazaguanosine (preQ0) biosynthesis protein QueE